MAGRGSVKAELVLSEDERATLERWARRPTSAQRLALRSSHRAGMRRKGVEPRGRRAPFHLADDGGQMAQSLRRRASRRAQRRPHVRVWRAPFPMTTRSKK